MATVFSAVPESLASAPTQRRVRFGSVEPATLVLLKQLDPVICVLTLLVFTIAYGATPLRHFTEVAVLTFFPACYIFNRSNREAALERRSATGVFLCILLECGCIAGIVLFTGFILKPTALFSPLVGTNWFVFTPMTLYGSYALRSRVRRRLADSAHAPRYIIIGANSIGFELFRRLPQRGFLGFFDFRSADRVTQVIDPEMFAGHCRDAAEFARTHGVCAIYIALPLANVPRIGDIVRELRDTTASVYFIPDVFAFDLIQGRLIEIQGIPALAVCDTPFYGMNAVLKRMTDLAFASLALLLVTPLMLLIAVVVKLSSQGPVIFRQRRYGLNGEEINVYKFRSMTVCEDGPMIAQATKTDHRVTSVGAFLRKTSLDELPQLFNVLEGKMSVVGPRPHAVAHNELYRRLISGYMIRHKVRPGITGLAQVNGFRGETDTVEKMRERVRYDLEYLSHWSPWLDSKIILKTIKIVWRDRNAY